MSHWNCQTTDSLKQKNLSETTIKKERMKYNFTKSKSHNFNCQKVQKNFVLNPLDNNKSEECHCVSNILFSIYFIITFILA